MYAAAGMSIFEIKKCVHARRLTVIEGTECGLWGGGGTGEL